ncbi:hypothetical protein Tco_1367940 [Tanacetum coccineum]
MLKYLCDFQVHEMGWRVMIMSCDDHGEIRSIKLKIVFQKAVVAKTFPLKFKLNYFLPRKSNDGPSEVRGPESSNIEFLHSRYYIMLLSAKVNLTFAESNWTAAENSSCDCCSSIKSKSTCVGAFG